MGWARIEVNPTAWSRLVSAGRIDKRKDRKAASAAAALNRWPTIPVRLVKEYAIADAAWIAEWARREDVVAGRVSSLE